jgi:hypothetical protein
MLEAYNVWQYREITDLNIPGGPYIFPGRAIITPAYAYAYGYSAYIISGLFGAR